MHFEGFAVGSAVAGLGESPGGDRRAVDVCCTGESARLKNLLHF